MNSCRASFNLLDQGLRAARLRDLLRDCVSSALEQEADRLRDAALLLGGEGSGKPSVDLCVLETMIASGAGVSAALAIIGDDASFMLSRGGNGSCLATFVLADGSEEMIAEGASLALALLAAHISALLGDIEQAGELPFLQDSITASLLH